MRGGWPTGEFHLERSSFDTAFPNIDSQVILHVFKTINVMMGVKIQSKPALKYKAYIPPERKIPGVGGWRWAMHPTPEFCVTQRKIYQHVGISGVR